MHRRAFVYASAAGAALLIGNTLPEGVMSATPTPTLSADEARTIADILSREFDVVSVCCKISGLAKEPLGLERINPDDDGEIMCNPAGQAMVLNDAGTELNILCGLCVGHDAVFSMVSRAPVTTLIAKDRVLAHNPIGAVYSRYIRRRLLPDAT